MEDENGSKKWKGKGGEEDEKNVEVNLQFCVIVEINVIGNLSCGVSKRIEVKHREHSERLDSKMLFIHLEKSSIHILYLNNAFHHTYEELRASFLQTQLQV